ncbi:MAG: response regulator, partial [Desulfobacterales bacterium]
LLEFIVVGTTDKRQKAAPLAQETKPDLLIFDCNMGSDEMAGFSDLKNLKRQLPNLKILALDNHEAIEEFAERYTNSIFDGYWNKYDGCAGFFKQLNFLFP